MVLDLKCFQISMRSALMFWNVLTLLIISDRTIQTNFFHCKYCEMRLICKYGKSSNFSL